MADSGRAYWLVTKFLCYAERVIGKVNVTQNDGGFARLDARLYGNDRVTLCGCDNDVAQGMTGALCGHPPLTSLRLFAPPSLRERGVGGLLKEGDGNVGE